MAITVTMIEEKEFKTKMRGYDPVEVDEFLDEICDEMVAMQEEIISLQSRLAKSGSRVFGQPAPMVPPSAVPAPPVLEQAAPEQPKQTDTAEEAARLLRSAQKVYDDTVADAKREADRIVADAKNSVSDENVDLEKERETLENELRELRKAAKEYRDKFKELLDGQQDVLDKAGELFDEE